MGSVTHLEGTQVGGGQVRDELRALVTGSAVYRTDRALFLFTGADRVRWLNGMVSNNIRDLATGAGVYAFVLNPQGHIQGDLYAFNRGESLVIELDRTQSEKLMPLLRRYIIMDKVVIENLSERIVVIEVMGPKSAEALEILGLNQKLGTLRLVDFTWNGSEMTIVHGDNPAIENYELWVPVGAAQSVRETLANAGASEVHADALETFRVICGIPKVGQDIRDRTLPQETGQERALNFSKGCYIGQEIVERIRARGSVHRTFTGFEVKGPRPPASAKIQSDGKEVGEITSTTIVPSDQGENVIALGYIRKEVLAAGKELTAGDAKVKPTSLPFARFLH